MTLDWAQYVSPVSLSIHLCILSWAKKKPKTEGYMYYIVEKILSDTACHPGLIFIIKLVLLYHDSSSNGSIAINDPISSVYFSLACIIVIE